MVSIGRAYARVNLKYCLGLMLAYTALMHRLCGIYLWRVLWCYSVTRRVCMGHVLMTQFAYSTLPRAGRICGAYAILALHIIICLIYILRINIKFAYALHMHKTQRGEKLNVVRKVLTTLNFVTTPSFSVTTPICKPGFYLQNQNQLSIN